MEPGSHLGSDALVVARDRERDLQIAAVFGTRVRELRTLAELTQEDLAEATGLHPTFVSNLERGRRVPSLATVIRVAAGLKVSASTLVEGIS